MSIIDTAQVMIFIASKYSSFNVRSTIAYLQQYPRKTTTKPHDIS
jgi:hypothetical protein